MSRRPLAWILAALPLFAGGPAVAYTPPSQPDAAEPVADVSPKAPFNADAPGALLASERAWLQTTEGGRFVVARGRVSDTREPDPKKRVLTNERMEEILRRRAGERVAALRRAPLDEGARREASSLLWLRGTALSPADQKFLRGAANLPRLSAPQPGVNFDGGAAHGGVVGGPYGPGRALGGPVASAAAADDPVLLKNFMDRVEILPDSDPRSAPAIRAALGDILKTPTGREIARAFVAENAHAQVRFSKVEGSATVLENGKRVIQASGGNTETWQDPPIVNLNRDYLDTDPDYMRMNVAATLAHEMLGHGLQAQRDKRAGLPFEINNSYRGDEANAGLIGWLVQTELGGPLDNGHMWNYLKNPEIYHRSLQTNMAYYSVSFSTAEMLDPVGTLKSRLGGVVKARARLQTSADEMKFWRKVVEHFIQEHGVPRDRFKSISDDIDGFLGHWVKLASDNFDEIDAALKAKIALLESPKGAELLKAYKAAAGSAVLAEDEARLARYRARLAKLTEGRHPEESVPPVPGMITWDELGKMWENDDPVHKAALQ
jgi:hypothetical protein